MSGEREGRSRVRRVLWAFAIALLVQLPFSFVTSQYWLSHREDAGEAAEEQRGVQYLRPVVSLVAALTTAQSAAVGGGPSDAATVRRALEEVGGVDALLGAALGTTARWTTLRGRIEELTERPPTGADAYRAYSEVVDLALALVAKAGDTSHLILDPELDSYYLMDIVLRRLPAVLVDAGRYVDLVTLAAATPPELAAVYLSEAAVVTDRLGVHSAAVDEGLRMSMDATGDRELAPGLVGRADSFRIAVNDVAPLVRLTETPQPLPALGELGPRRERLDRATLELEKIALDALDSRLSLRQDVLSVQGVGIIVAAALGLIAAGWVFWTRLPPQHKQRTVDAGDDEDDERLPVHVVPGEESLTLLDARDLLAQGELVRVGRAVQRSRQEPEDDAQ